MKSVGTIDFRIETIDGSAKRNEDYIPIREVITFAPHEDQKKVSLSPFIFYVKLVLCQQNT